MEPGAAADDRRVETAVRSALDAVGFPYEALPCDPAFADTAAFCERYGVAPEDSANTIVVAGKAEPRRYAACVVLATTRLDVNGTVRRRLGVRKASFASAEETRALTGMSIGGVTPLALDAGLPVWVDGRVMTRASIVLGGGSRSLKIRVTPQLFDRLPAAEIVPDLAGTIDPG
ncbi:MAG TPA: YbaK/EbsC family protein [Acidimicrobiales bacterium]|nr:YbaK/EbsC family protein [Acidimicrobiales bacterium]